MPITFDQIDNLAKNTAKTYASILRDVHLADAIKDPVAELKRLGYSESKCVDVCKALRGAMKAAIASGLVQETDVDPRVLKGSYMKNIVKQVLNSQEQEEEEVESVAVTELTNEADETLIGLMRRMIPHLPDEQKTEIALFFFDKVYGPFMERT